MPQTLETTLTATVPGTGELNVPVGSIVAWHKSLTGVPPLPEEWIECDGSTITDPASPMYGQTVPDLNHEQRFLRGNTASGTTGGEAKHALTTAEMAAHSHTVKTLCSSTITNQMNAIRANPGDIVRTTCGSSPTTFEGNSNPHNNEPQYFDAVWIIKIK